MPGVSDCWNSNISNGATTIQGIECVVQAILNIAVKGAGIALFIMLIIAGVLYLTSGGSPEKIQKAQKTLTAAVLGLVLLLAAWLILIFIGEFTGVDVTQFTIPK